MLRVPRAGVLSRCVLLPGRKAQIPEAASSRDHAQEDGAVCEPSKVEQSASGSLM